MKILKHILKWAVWGMVSLMVMLIALPHIPSVQLWLGERTASFMSQLLGTEVRVGRVDVGLFNRIILDDVIIKDQQHEDLLRVNRLSARIELHALAEGRVSVSSAQLFGAHANLYQKDSLSQPNFQFVLDSLASNDTTSSSTLNLRINSLIVRHSSVSYNRQDKPLTKGLFNPNHLDISDVSAHVVLKTLTDDSLNINVKRLALKEHSGLTVNRLSFRMEASATAANLTDFRFRMPHSDVQMEHLTAQYDTADIKESLKIAGTIDRTFLQPSDFSCFCPQLEHYTFPIELNTSFSGSLSSLEVRKLALQAKHQELALESNGWLSLTSRPFASWQVRHLRLYVSQHLLSQLSNDFQLPAMTTRMGYAELNGQGDCHSSGLINADCQLNTGVGNMVMQFQTTKDLHFSGHLATDGLDLRTLLDDHRMDKLSTQVDFSGSPATIFLKGNVNHLDFKNYSYNDILIDGSCSANEIAGRLKVNDPNIQTDIDGLWRRNGKTNDIRLTGFIRNLSPKKLNLSDQWSSATFAAAIDADFSASSLNDARGTIDVDDFEINDSIGIYQIDNIHVKSGYEEGIHYLKINGDIGEAELKGKFDWDTLPQSFINYVAAKLPTLPGLPRITHEVNNDFSINLRLTDAEWMYRIFNIPLSLESPLLLHASVDDKSQAIDVTGHLPGFIYDDGYYNGGEIRITSPNDTMRCRMTVTKQMEDGQKMDLSLNALAADNNLNSIFSWNNNEKNEDAMSGMLNVITVLHQGAQGKPEAHLRIQPSRLVMANTVWDIEPCDILYSTDNLYVDHFLIHHGQQHLLVNGMASKSTTDTLVVNLQGLEVAYVMDLVNFHSVEFSGAASGKLVLTNAFNRPSASAKLTVEQFRFENGRMGTLYADAEWNNEQEQIDIHATAKDGPEATTYINGYVSPVRNSIDLDIQGAGTYVEFVHTYTESFLSDVTGHAYGKLKLAGPLSHMNLTGDLAVEGEATVTSLGTTYQLLGDTVHFVPDDIQLNRVRVRDRLGNTGFLSGGIHHEHLTSLTFDLDVTTERLLAYEFHDFGESLFYGTVFCQGTVDLHGRPGEVTINCDVTPLTDTKITYNAAKADAISNQEFVTWRDAQANERARQTLKSGASAQQAEETDVPTDIHINFLVNTTADSEVRLLMDAKTNDYITLYGSGVIRATFYNKGPFQMFGTYTIDRGTYDITIQNIIRKNFTFQEGGTIVFGGNPFDASLDMQAVYTVNGVSLSDLNIGNTYKSNTIRVNCLMNILGQAGAPKVEFDLDMPTVSSDEKQIVRSVIANEQEMNQQVLYLLGVGRFYTQGNNNAASQQYNQTSLAMQSFLSGTVSAQINDVLSQVIKSNDWNFGANISTGNEGWHNAEYEGLVSGRMLNNRLLVNGQFGYRDNAAQATPSFIGDFDIRYLLYPNGNLALKVYNQTNDRYFTRSSLNTQGIGLIIKKDFNGLNDLFFPSKKKNNLNQ